MIQVLREKSTKVKPIDWSDENRHAWIRRYEARLITGSGPPFCIVYMVDDPHPINGKFVRYASGGTFRQAIDAGARETGELK